MLFLCGLPGGYPDDLIDVDLDALEGEGVIRVSNADYLARPLRLTPTEATAIIVALRALRGRGGRRDPRGRRPGPGQARGGRGRGHRRWSTRATTHRATLALRGQLEDAVRRAAAGPADLLRAGARRGVRARRRPARASCPTTASTTSTRGATAPTRPGCSASTGSTRPTVLDSAVVTDAGRSRATSRPGCSPAARRPRWSRSPCTPRPGGSRSTTSIQAVRPGPDGGSEVDLLVGDEQWLQRLLLRLAPYAEVVSPPHFADGSRRGDPAGFGLYDHPAG